MIPQSFCSGTASLAATGLILLLTSVAAPRAVAQGVDSERPLPAIPKAAVDVEDLIAEIVGISSEIADAGDRFRALTYVLYDVAAASPNQRRPVIKAIAGTVHHVDKSQILYSNRESLVLYAPLLAVHIALHRSDSNLRDTYLADVIPSIAKDRPERAKELIKEIRKPSDRARALFDYAEVVNSSFEETCHVLGRAAKLAWNADLHGSRLYYFEKQLMPFAAGRPSEVGDFLQKHLEPHEAIWVLTRIAWDLAHRRGAPEAAEILVAKAQHLMPHSRQPYHSAMQLIGSCDQQLTAHEARRLFDKYIWPAICTPEVGQDRALSYLADYGMPLLVSYARDYAETMKVPLIQVLPNALRRTSPEQAISWLESQPSSPLRAKCVAEVASALRFDVPDPDLMEGTGKRWLRTLETLAVEIEDDRTRWDAYDSLLKIAKDLYLPRDEIRKNWWPLQQELEATDESNDPKLSLGFDFQKLPLKEQKRRLEDQLRANPENEQYWKNAQDGLLLTLRRIRHSSLSDAEKERLYRRMVSQLEHDPLTTTQIVSVLAVYDYPRALQLIWGILPTPRNLESGYGFCAYPEPPVNAKMAMRWLRMAGNLYIERGKENVVINALWSLAHRAPQVDRDAILRELTRVLIKAEQFEQAHAVARRIDEPAKEMDALGDLIVAVTREHKEQ